MHNSHINEEFDALRSFARHMNIDNRVIADAYVRGFICHYTLDSIAHPFIFALQNALLTAGVENLDEKASSHVHAQIESDLDAMMLWRTKGVTIKDFKPRKQILLIDDAALDIVDDLHRFTVSSAFRTGLKPRDFNRAVKDMRFATRVLHSPHGIKRATLGRFERTMRDHSLVQALSPRNDIFETCDFDNREHAEWRDPGSPEVSSASFHDLFELAQNAAFDKMELHARGVSSEEFTGGKNFSGLKVE
ncbi:MAG: hypothetical protein HGA54_10360 [Actinobacteria bacterium]|nr:hypothetical protein [Actinomycetota bacterium]